MKRFMILCICIGALCVVLIVGAENVENGICGDHLTWSFSGGLLTIQGTGQMERYECSGVQPWESLKEQITSLVVGSGVTSISEFAFNGCSNLSSVSLPEGLLSIGNSAFSACYALQEIDLPSTLHSIDIFAFSSSGLQSIALPDSVTSIGEYCFSYSPISELKLSEGLTSIPDGCFACVNLTTLTIPDGITEIEPLAFQWQNNLTEIHFGVGITSIQDDAFLSSCNLTDVYYKGSIAQLDNIMVAPGNQYLGNALWHCQDGNVEGFGPNSGKCGDNLTWSFSSGKLTIQGQGSMYEYGLPNSTPWEHKKLRIISVDIGPGITTISEDAFNSCWNLTSVSLPEGLLSIGTRAFEGCEALQEIDLPNSLCSLGMEAFCSTGLQNLVLPDSVIEIGAGCFWGAPLTELTISAGLTNIPAMCFAMGALTTVYIPDNIVTIEANAFADQEDLLEVHLSDGIERIQSGAFGGCNNLKDIYYDGTVAQSERILIEDYNQELIKARWHCSDDVVPGLGPTTGNCGDSVIWSFSFSEGTLTIEGQGSMNEYDYDLPPWESKKFLVTSIVVKPGVTSIGGCAFSSCYDLVSVRLPEGLLNIGENAFNGCYMLQEIDLPNTLCSIGRCAFKSTGLQSLVLPNSVTNIGEYCFSYTPISELTLSEGLTIIPEGCFAGGNLTSIVIPTSITYIHPYSFSEQWNLTELHLQDGLISLQHSAFRNCSNLLDVYYTGTMEQAENVFIGYDNQYVMDATWHCNNGDLDCLVAGERECDHSSLSIHNGVEPTCTTSGMETYWSCDICGMLFSDADAANQIEYPMYLPGGHLLVYGSVLVEATCTESGLIEGPYCDRCGEVIAETSILPPLGHQITINQAVAPTLTTAGLTRGEYCSNCEMVFVKQENIPALDELSVLWLPSSLNTIEEFAFENLSCQAVIVPYGCRSIGKNAFLNCKDLLYVKIPETTIYLATDAFEGCRENLFIDRESFVEPVTPTDLGI